MGTGIKHWLGKPHIFLSTVEDRRNPLMHPPFPVTHAPTSIQVDLTMWINSWFKHISVYLRLVLWINCPHIHSFGHACSHCRPQGCSLWHCRADYHWPETKKENTLRNMTTGNCAYSLISSNSCCYLWKKTLYLPTEIPRISAWSCINKLFTVIPPSTWRDAKGIPQSMFIASKSYHFKNRIRHWYNIFFEKSKIIWKGIDYHNI